MKFARRIGRFGLVALALAGCQSSSAPAITQPPPETIRPPAPPPPPVPYPTEAQTPRRLRRLNNSELENVLADALGARLDLTKGFLPDPRDEGYDNDVVALAVSESKIDEVATAAERASAWVTAAANLARLAPCPTLDTPAACAHAFADRLARGAWGRIPSAEELARLDQVFGVGLANEGYGAGIGLVTQAILQSPHFLYVSELGGEPAGAQVQLTDFEIASQISLLVRGSRPDQALFDAAVAGALADPDAREREARRLLASPEARRHLSQFVRDWLGLTRPVNKDMAVVPILQPSLRAAMNRELATFLDYVLANADTLDELMLADYTFANPALQLIYGNDLLDPPGDFTRVRLDPRRRGILSSPMFLATHALINQTNPIERGLVVRTRLLCQDIPPPPPDVAAQTPTGSPGQTTRQKYEAHDKDPRCRACHQYMDPIGFGFEQFDLLGRYQTKEGDATIDAGGALVGTDVDGYFSGPAALAQRLARSAGFHRCFVKNLWRFAEARAADENDDQEIDALTGTFEDKRRNIDELVVALVRKPTFILRKVVP